MHNRGDHSGCRRNRQTDKMPFGYAFGRLLRLRIESGEAQSATDDEREGCKRAELVHMLRSRPIDPFTGPKSPAESEYGGRNSEGDDIRNGVQLDAKVACGFCQTCDPPVQAVEHITDADENGGIVPITAQRGNDRIVAAENVSY